MRSYNNHAWRILLRFSNIISNSINTSEIVVYFCAATVIRHTIDHWNRTDLYAIITQHHTGGKLMSIANAIECNTVQQLTEMRHKLTENKALAERFEQTPKEMLEQIDNEIQINLHEGRTIDLIQSIVEAPAGTRLLTLDYCLGLIQSNGTAKDPDDPPAPTGPIPIPVVGVNVAAIYNAAVIGNAVAYHDVGAGIEVVAGAVAIRVKSAIGMADTPLANVNQRRRTVQKIKLSRSYLAGTTHQHFEHNNIGESRERMILRRLIGKTDSLEDGLVEITHDHRGETLNIRVNYNKDNNEVLVVDGYVVR